MFASRLILAIFFLLHTSTSISSPAINIQTSKSAACKYKVWYLEDCDPEEKVQIVHLILSKGGVECEVAKHLTKVCHPSPENDHPVAPKQAMFRKLLLSRDHTIAALKKEIARLKESSELPEALTHSKQNASKGISKAELLLLKELEDFDKARDKTGMKASIESSPSESTEVIARALIRKSEAEPSQSHGSDQAESVEIIRQLLKDTRSQKAKSSLEEHISPPKPTSSPSLSSSARASSSKKASSASSKGGGFFSKIASLFGKSKKKTSTTTVSPEMQKKLEEKDMFKDIEAELAKAQTGSEANRKIVLPLDESDLQKIEKQSKTKAQFIKKLLLEGNKRTVNDTQFHSSEGLIKEGKLLETFETKKERQDESHSKNGTNRGTKSSIIDVENIDIKEEVGKNDSLKGMGENLPPGKADHEGNNETVTQQAKIKADKNNNKMKTLKQLLLTSLLNKKTDKKASSKGLEGGDTKEIHLNQNQDYEEASDLTQQILFGSEATDSKNKSVETVDQQGHQHEEEDTAMILNKLLPTEDKQNQNDTVTSEAIVDLEEKGNLTHRMASFKRDPDTMDAKSVLKKIMSINEKIKRAEEDTSRRDGKKGRWREGPASGKGSARDWIQESGGKWKIDKTWDKDKRWTEDRDWSKDNKWKEDKKWNAGRKWDDERKWDADSKWNAESKWRSSRLAQRKASYSLKSGEDWDTSLHDQLQEWTKANGSSKTKVINWMIQNFPQGKQTIVIL